MAYNAMLSRSDLAVDKVYPNVYYRSDTSLHLQLQDGTALDPDSKWGVRRYLGGGDRGSRIGGPPRLACSRRAALSQMNRSRLNLVVGTELGSEGEHGREDEREEDEDHGDTVAQPGSQLSPVASDSGVRPSPTSTLGDFPISPPLRPGKSFSSSLPHTTRTLPTHFSNSTYSLLIDPEYALEIQAAMGWEASTATLPLQFDDHLPPSPRTSPDSDTSSNTAVSGRSLDESVKVLFPADPDQRDAPQPPAGVTSLPSLFIHQAKVQPDCPFLTFYDGSDESPSLTYGEAFERVQSLAKALTPHLASTSPKKSVGIWFEKSIDLHLAILTTTLSGAGWLPFDPDAPTERVSTCMSDSEAQVILVDETHRERALEAVKNEQVKAKVLMLDELTGGDKYTLPNEDDTAYMIYTSGSTGTPKGIEIPHSAALTFALSERTVLKTCEKDIVWQGFSPAFDMFVEEVWVSIAGGAHLVVGSREVCQNVADLGSVWTKHDVTVVNAVPTMINIMTSLSEDGGLPASVRLINLGGEACPPSLVKRLWRPDLVMINTYGPTETTVSATAEALVPDAPVTIGRPLPSYHALIMPIADDEPEGSVPTTPIEPLDIAPGVEGQLCIGGPCLGKGYVKLPDLTAEKYMEHPLDPNARLYQTGDRVRLDDKCNIHFIGRIDTQVKHRGFRIELGEIESALSSHAGVQVAAVICARAGEEDAQLEAYLVMKSGEAEVDQTTRTELQDCLSGLPAYMHPEAYFYLRPDEMPRLPSGKVNAKGLAVISEEEKAAKASAQPAVDLGEYTGSLATLMTAMAAVFPQQATSGELTPDADFFDDLGGHSLTAAILVSRLRKETTGSALETLGLADIYQLRTARAIADKYADTTSDSETLLEPEENSEYQPVSAWRYFICGVFQIPPLIFFAFVHSVVLLAPYFLFAEMVTRYNPGYALLSTYGCFVVFPPLLTILGICGKWLFLGRSREGEHKLYGFYYYRWWIAGRFSDLVDHKTWGELAMYPVILRLLGAKVGKHCHLAAMAIGPCVDMVEIGDDVVFNKDVTVTASVIERGLLVIRRVRVGNEANIGSHSVLDGGAVIGEGAELAPLTMVANGVTIPRAERWHGSPAQYLYPAPNTFQGKATRPGFVRWLAFNTAAYVMGLLLMPLLWTVPQVPGLWLFIIVQLPGFSPWVRTAILAFPTSLGYIICVFLEMVILRRILLPRIKPGVPHKTTSWFMLRKWLVDRSMDLSLVTLHSVYATLYVVPYLRALGMKIGRSAEVSNAKGFTYDLTDIGDEAFVADNARLGDVQISGNTVTFEKTVISPRAFTGNSSLLPQGTVLEPNTLVGVLSVGPDGQHVEPLKSGESCFGSPPVRMPRRQAAKVHHADEKLYRPTALMIAERLFIEGMRIWLPRVVIVFAIGFSVQIFQTAVLAIGALYTLLMLPFYEIIMFCLPALAVTVALKWALVQRYKSAEWPLWSRTVWFSEAVTSTAESLIYPLFVLRLVGTPFLPMVMRLLGARIGKRVTMMAFDITEWDMVSIGDEAVINMLAGPQTHLFEDRVMKVGHVTLEDRAVLAPNTICLPNSRVGQASQLGSLSLLMKGESVPRHQRWQGAPVARRATHYGYVKGHDVEAMGSRRKAENGSGQPTAEKGV